MEQKAKKPKNLDTVLYMRISQKDKEKCNEIAKSYGMPNFSTYVRYLIKLGIENYERKGEK